MTLHGRLCLCFCLIALALLPASVLQARPATAVAGAHPASAAAQAADVDCHQQSPDEDGRDAAAADCCGDEDPAAGCGGTHCACPSGPHALPLAFPATVPASRGPHWPLSGNRDGARGLDAPPQRPPIG